MKKYIAVALMLLFPSVMLADARSGQIIERLSTIIKGYKNYEVSFTANVNEGAQVVSGKYVVAGNRYLVEAAGRLIYSDGNNKYDVNPEDREVVIDKINPNDKDILSNPVRAFEFVGSGYSHVYKGEGVFDGQKCQVVELKSTGKKSAVTQIELMVDPASGLPLGVKYKFDGEANIVEIKIRKISRLTSVDASQFVFSKARHKGFEIIDFR